MRDRSSIGLERRPITADVCGFESRRSRQAHLVGR